MSQYLIHRVAEAPRFEDDFFTGPLWSQAEELKLEQVFHKPDSDPADRFTPDCRLKLLHDGSTVYGMFRVEDRSITISRTGFQQSVCQDSCVEIFLQPQGGSRYMNFEFSGGTAMLLYNIVVLRGKEYTAVSDENCSMVIRKSTLPARVMPENPDPVTWKFFFAIPAELFAKELPYVSTELSGQVWRGNVSKCADDSSHPVWLSWQYLPVLDFHQPDCFGEFRFE